MFAVYFYCCCCCKVFLQKCTIACIWLLQIRREEKTTTSTVNIKWRPLVSANHSPPPHVSFCRKFLRCCFGFSQSTWRHSVAFHAQSAGVHAALLICGVSLAHRVERCQREARPPGAGISPPSGGSLSTTLRICQTTTPRPREELCSAPRLEVLMSRMRKERDSE